MDDTITFFLISLILFTLIILVFKRVYNYIKNNSDNRLLNLEEYLPVEEIQTLKQVSYLIIITLFLIDVFYNLIFYSNNLVYFAIYDIFLCLFTITLIKTDDIKSYILIFALMPFQSLDYLIFNSTHILMDILSIIHFISLIYVMYHFYNRFRKYTTSNGLSYTILLLFIIIFISFVITSIVENVNLLDSLVMVSNAFTSNGYAILGESIFGKINGIFLVWSGYVLSGVGTATLTATIIIRYYNKKFNELKESIEELKENK